MSLQSTVPSAMAVATAGMKGRIGDEYIRSKAVCSMEVYTFGLTAADTISTVTVNGVAYSANSGSGTMTIANMLAALVTAINAGQGTYVLCTATATVLTIKSIIVGTAFTITAGANVASLTLVNANAVNIPYGVFVVTDANDENSAKLPDLTAEVTTRKLIGITAFAQGREQTDEGYALNSEMAIVTHTPGRWVKCEQAMVNGDQIFVRYATTAGGTGGTTQRGVIRKDADTSTAVGITNASVLEYDSTTGLALVALNLPN